MKFKALLLLLTAGIALSAPARAQTYETLFAFTGYDYQDANTVLPVGSDLNHDAYLAVGEGYKVVGFVTSFGPLLTPYVDQVQYEYTDHLYNLTVAVHSFFGGFFEADFANGGRGRYYRDPYSGGTAATYGTNPPNATAPSTFIDGSMRIGGSVDNFILTYNYNAGNGNFSGTMNLDEGPDLIYVPAPQRLGWTLAGLAGPPQNGTVPAGYDNQVSGECKILTTPTTHKTWGALKALYR
jgi:hypothetical protein